jgi:hypothetical protein
MVDHPIASSVRACATFAEALAASGGAYLHLAISGPVHNGPADGQVARIEREASIGPPDRRLLEDIKRELARAGGYTVFEPEAQT